MKFDTKFNIGDTVHFLVNNRHVESIVRRINITVTTEGIVGNYSCNQDDDKLVGIKCDLNDAFATKEDLVKSI